MRFLRSGVPPPQRSEEKPQRGETALPGEEEARAARSRGCGAHWKVLPPAPSRVPWTLRKSRWVSIHRSGPTITRSSRTSVRSAFQDSFSMSSNPVAFSIARPMPQDLTNSDSVLEPYKL